MAATELAKGVAALVARHLDVPEGAVEVAELRRLAGGASRELWALDVVLRREGGVESLPLVLRRDPPGRSGESDRALEARLLVAAAEAGVPVPRVLCSGPDPERPESACFLMERLEGEAIPRRLLRDAAYADLRAGLARELGRVLARIHTIDPDAPALAGLPRPAAGRAPALDQIETLAAGVREMAPEPHPVLDLAERWLRERAPTPGRRTLVHGDYRMGNVLCDAQGVRGVLDWELAHVGDPVEDLAWLCTRAWRFGHDAQAAGGVGTREELLAGYAEGGGAPVDPAALGFWEALGSYKVAFVFIQQSHVFLSGKHPSLELASLGRRTAEAEAELVRILEASP